VSSDDPEWRTRLGYLLKHAQQRLYGLHSAALTPFGLDGRLLAVLMMLASGEPASQQEIAQRVGIDRTTMVSFVDTLTDKGFVTRRPSEEDRRKNVVELTDAGRTTLRAATKASDEAERQFLTALTPQAARQFREALYALVHQES
jgi:DNA-binding MarR family transcriptional regulator